MRTFILLSLLIISCSTTFAQAPGGAYVIDLNQIAFRTGHSSTEWANFYKNSDAEGSQFLEESWSKGTIILKNDTMVPNLDYRYNIFARQMQIRTYKDTLVLTHPEKVRSLIFNNRTFIYDHFVKGNITAQDYFEVIVDGKCRMLLQREVTFVPKNPPTTPYSPGYVNDRFVYHEFVYLQQKDAPAFYIKCNKKSVLAFLSDHQNELKLYIKNEKIRFNDNYSVAKLIRYYNSLVEKS